MILNTRNSQHILSANDNCSAANPLLKICMSNKSSPIFFLMMDGEYKRNIIDHVEIVDEIPEVNDLATGTEKGRKTSTESIILSIDDISK